MECASAHNVVSGIVMKHSQITILSVLVTTRQKGTEPLLLLARLRSVREERKVCARGVSGGARFVCFSSSNGTRLGLCAWEGSAYPLIFPFLHGQSTHFTPNIGLSGQCALFVPDMDNHVMSY